jgi:triosephosphate isomerase
MYKTIKETTDFLSRLNDLTRDISREEMELFVIPSYTALSMARSIVDSQEIKIGAQNMCWDEKGQFTGEISPLMLKEIDIDLVMVGHSERRHLFGEKDEEENLKVAAAINYGFTALLCVGETQKQKEDNISDEALKIQLKCGVKGISNDMVSHLWIAYEPVWAIGVNGRPASAEYANEKHNIIKECLLEIFGEAGGDVPVLYGGSVNNENAADLISKDNIDGLFIGRSAWDADNFNKIIRSVLPLFKQRKKDSVIG